MHRPRLVRASAAFTSIVARTPRPAPAVPLLLAPALVLALVLSPSVAWAAAPATVTVRVEGFTQTLLPLTQVTTATDPVNQDGQPGHSCTGTSVLGALDDATRVNNAPPGKGDWVGKWDGGFGYEVDGIEGENFPAFSPSNSPDAFWYEWVNAPGNGACADELNAHDQVLFFPQCTAPGSDCPNGATSPDPLSVTAPATAQSGAPVTVTVTRYDNGTGKPSPADGATVAAGAVSATTDARGMATLTFPSAGTLTLQASGPSYVRSETHSVCVHNGDDGNCGTSGPAGSPSPPIVTTTATSTPASSGVLGSTFSGPFALVAAARGPLDGHVYSHRHAPRLLTGAVAAHTTIASVSLRLRRSFRGRCSAYSGIKARWYATRCGRGSFFAVGRSATFSYLLPAPLARGRYVYDIQASDTAGHRTLLARGTSRVVFYVK
jgi:hypothetical protein